MLLVYVDTGGMLKEVAALEAAGLLKTHYFPFEQRNRRVKTFVPGSGATWKQSNLSSKGGLLVFSAISDGTQS